MLVVAHNQPRSMTAGGACALTNCHVLLSQAWLSWRELLCIELAFSMRCTRPPSRVPSHLARPLPGDSGSIAPNHARAQDNATEIRKRERSSNWHSADSLPPLPSSRAPIALP